MRLKIKLIAGTALAVFAIVCLLAVLSDLGLGPQTVLASAESGYVLRTWDGYIGVFCPPDSKQPAVLTDVRVRDLPMTDRLALTKGIPAADYGQVVRLLEDYGA